VRGWGGVFLAAAPEGFEELSIFFREPSSEIGGGIRGFVFLGGSKGHMAAA
jgi:hypothetical protein